MSPFLEIKAGHGVLHPDDELLSEVQWADMVGVSTPTIHTYAQEKNIPLIKMANPLPNTSAFPLIAARHFPTIVDEGHTRSLAHSNPVWELVPPTTPRDSFFVVQTPNGTLFKWYDASTRPTPAPQRFAYLHERAEGIRIVQEKMGKLMEQGGVIALDGSMLLPDMKSAVIAPDIADYLSHHHLLTQTLPAMGDEPEMKHLLVEEGARKHLYLFVNPAGHAIIRMVQGKEIAHQDSPFSLLVTAAQCYVHTELSTLPIDTSAIVHSTFLTMALEHGIGRVNGESLLT